MKIASKQYARALYELTIEAKKNELDGLIISFAKFLVQNNDLFKIDSIVDEFNDIFQAASGEIKVELTSAKQLPEEIKNKLKEYLIKRTGSKEINLLEKIEKDIIGGFILRYNDLVIDGSLKNNLSNFKKQLSN